MHTNICMSLHVHWIDTTKSSQIMVSHNELQNLQICPKWHPSPNTYNPMHEDTFQFVNICVNWNVSNLTSIARVFFMWLNILSEWILDLTSITKCIYNIIGWDFLKCQTTFFFIGSLIKGHYSTNGKCSTNWWWVYLWITQLFIDKCVFNDRCINLK